MTTTGPRTFGLSEWYARLGSDDPAAGGTGLDDTTVVAGPLTVFRADRGCEIARFGPGERNVVVHDGYLFDRAALAEELGCGADTADAVLLSAAYERWGTRLFERVDGAYLAAVWDAAAGRLLLGHDALGRHPAYYVTERGDTWFTSNILALAGSGRVSRRPNRRSLALSFLLYWPEAGETHFEQIRRVRPGHYLEIRRGSAVSETQYWEPMPPDDEPWLPDDEVHERFEPELKRAVERRLALAPQGIMLSGGVDSVTIAALASQCRSAASEPLVAVSGRTGDDLSHEERMQSSVAEALGMALVVSSTADWLAGRDSIEASLDICDQLPSPTRIWWVGTYTGFYRRTAGQGLNVLLTGAGGDNWLGVADAYAADLLRRLRLLEFARFVKADVGTGGASLKDSARRLLWAGGVLPLVNSTWAMLAPGHKSRYHRRKWSERLPEWLCPDLPLRRDLLDCLIERRTPDRDRSGARPRNYYRHSLRSAGNPYLHFEGETAHHMQQWCGLRLLSPYHDHRLVGFLNRISPQTLLHGGRYKGLLRPLAEKYLPGLGLERQRKDYPREQQERRLGELRRSVARAWQGASMAELGRLGVVDADALADEMKEAGPADFSDLAQAFTVMSAERWVRARTSS